MTEQDFVQLIDGVHGYLGLREGYLLYELACKTSSPYVLEIGALHGLSSIFLAKSGKHVISVDIWDNQDISDGKRHISADIECYMRNMVSRGFHNFTPFKMSSKQVAEELSVSFDIGLIFIDGKHTYPAVCSDIQDWEPKLKPNTWFLFHDYTQPCGVKQAVDEWAARNSQRIQERIDVCSIIGFRL